MTRKTSVFQIDLSTIGPRIAVEDDGEVLQRVAMAENIALITRSLRQREPEAVKILVKSTIYRDSEGDISGISLKDSYFVDQNGMEEDLPAIWIDGLKRVDQQPVHDRIEYRMVPEATTHIRDALKAVAMNMAVEKLPSSKKDREFTSLLNISRDGVFFSLEPVEPAPRPH